MTFAEMAVPAGMPLSDAARIIEEAIEGAGLRVTSRGTLVQYPGSIHWHVKRGKEAGTLEITLLNRERYIRLAVHANRAGTWTADALTQLADDLRERLPNPAEG